MEEYNKSSSKRSTERRRNNEACSKIHNKNIPSTLRSFFRQEVAMNLPQMKIFDQLRLAGTNTVSQHKTLVCTAQVSDVEKM